MRTNRSLILLILFIILTSISTFGSGFFLSSLLSQEKINTLPPAPTPTQIKNQPIQKGTTNHYFDDSILFITKTTPRKILIMSAVRRQNTSGYDQNQRVSYFDGTSWKRKIQNTKTLDSAIARTTLLPTWNIKIDPSLVLKERTEGQVILDETSITFSSNLLENEIGMRSLPGYTKFMSEGEGSLHIGNTILPVNIVFTHIYSLDDTQIQFYDKPLGITTDWLAFWDQEGNFYHVDSTQVERPTPLYTTHTIGVKKSKDGEISKIFTVSVQRDKTIPPHNFSFNLPFIQHTTMELSTVQSFNKEPTNTYQWYLIEATGNVFIQGKSVEGYGVIEYIKD